MSTARGGFLRGSLPWCFSAVLIAAAYNGVAPGQVVTEFPIPTADAVPGIIAVGPDGNLWFTEISANKIGRITSSGAVTEFPTAGTFPYDIVAGPDGNLWFTDGDRIGRITTDGVIVAEFSFVTGSEYYGIAPGHDRSIWFTAYGDSFGDQHVVRYTPDDGLVFVSSMPSGGPFGIAAGPDGNMWFTETDGNRIGRITTTGVVTEFAITTPGSRPDGITAGPDGNLWFVESDGNRVGRITTAGVITEFSIPTPLSSPGKITVGPDGNLWFTETEGNQIGRITTEGVITEFPLPTAGSSPYGIVAGPDGDIWFTEPGINRIGRMTTGPCEPNATSLCLNDGRFRVRVSWSVPSQGRHGDGTAVPLTGDTGYFWFFDDANVELVVKVLDGLSLNGHFWLFYGGLSNVAYRITVTDTLTGDIRTYDNPDGTFASLADTSAFDLTTVTIDPLPSSSATKIEARSAGELYGLHAAQTPVGVVPKAAVADPCASGATLCLNRSRFHVSVDWEVPDQGRSGHATAVPITDDTGYFWFFGGDNVELVVKVLDGRAVNSHFWVFYGALSNVQYTITVTDTETHTVQTYRNPNGTLASAADTEAF